MTYENYILIMSICFVGICFVGLGLCFVIILLGVLPDKKKAKRKGK
jgi:hypothetical protein